MAMVRFANGEPDPIWIKAWSRLLFPAWRYGPGRGVKLIDDTARFVRSSGQAPGGRGRAVPKTIVAWPCRNVTVPVLVVTVTSPLSTSTP
jgi:hypothetical protein